MTNFIQWYLRTRADIREVAVWVAVVMVVVPALVHYSNYAAWSYLVAGPILLSILGRIVLQFIRV